MLVQPKINKSKKRLCTGTLDVQTFANRKFGACQSSRNLRHKLSRMRHKNLFREHKLLRIDAYILYLLEKIKQERQKMQIIEIFIFHEHKLSRIGPKFAKIAKVSARESLCA